MNFKKLVITGATAALLLGSAVGAFAHHSKPAPLPTTNVTNTGSINNESWNVANTGLNYVGGSSDKDKRHGHDNKGNSVTTGDAVAGQTTTNVISTSADCGCTTGGNTNVTNTGSVWNTSVNVANTGANYVDGKTSLKTGDATAGQDVQNVINTNVGASI